MGFSSSLGATKPLGKATVLMKLFEVFEMHQEDNLEIKLDAQGAPDVDYYIDKAHRLRAEALRDTAVDTGAWLRKQFQHLIHALHLDGHHASMGH